MQATSTEADASKTFEEKRQPRSKSLWVLSSLLHFSGEVSLLDALVINVFQIFWKSSNTTDTSYKSDISNTCNIRNICM